MSEFKINYKGCKMLLEFEYKCQECGHHHIIEQYRSDTMRGRKCLCKGCEGELTRFIRTAPLLDADYHEAHLTRNIGWDDNG